MALERRILAAWPVTAERGANDNLFTATPGGGSDNPDGEFPLPASGWMLPSRPGAPVKMKRG